LISQARNAIDSTLYGIKPLNLQVRLVIGFLIAAGLTGLVATLVGIRIINQNNIEMTHKEIRKNITTAQLIYDYQLERLGVLMQVTALRCPLQTAIYTGDVKTMRELSGLIRKDALQTSGMDMLDVADASGNVLYRAGNPDVRGDNILWDPVVRRCLVGKKPVTATALLPVGFIEQENPALASRTRIPILKTPYAIKVNEPYLVNGMVIRAAYPILDIEGNLLGVLAGGILLNKDYYLVDRIKQTNYGNEKYLGHDLGNATIFQEGVRISTNVMTSDNQRAVGTIISKEVYDRVIAQNKNWIGRRAFVANDWYISAYVPMYDIDHKIIGILYTGILEAKYRDLMYRTIWIFLGVTSLGMLLAFIISFTLGHSIIRRIRILKHATEAIASGNLNYQLPPGKSSGFDMLDEWFNNMAKSLKDRDERLQKAFSQITNAEKLAAVGQMAAGVAHEINNPLGGILLYSNLILEDMKPEDPWRENMEKIVYQTNRCKGIVQDLLNFARTPTGELLPLDINDVIRNTINLVKDQFAFFGVEITTDLQPNLPQIKGDSLKLEEVFLNLFMNAADAMGGKGRLTIKSEKTVDNHAKIMVSDTGKGIDKSFLPHIFEPFFTTKDAGHGTGLGLSIIYGILKNHNGSIHVESDPGSGTTFYILLPLHDGTV